MKKESKVTRLNLALPLETRTRIEWLQKQTESSSMTDVIQKALAITEWVVGEQNAGNDILTRKPGESPVVCKIVWI